MIVFNTLNMEIPFHEFIKFYKYAESVHQLNIEAACLSTVADQAKPHARFINIKYINNNEIIFFSNYTSIKAADIESNQNVALNFFWNSANIQIRIEGIIKKLSEKRSNDHWETRSKHKNALAISSNQSSATKSYKEVINNYEKVLNSYDVLKRPKYWGGYVIKPIYFEFWQGHDSRINKREVYEKVSHNWKHFIIQP